MNRWRNHFQRLFATGKTVFSLGDIQNILQISYQTAIAYAHRATRRFELISPYRGLFAFSSYSFDELATKIRIPCYISLETVLFRSGVIFQDYSHTITLVSWNTLTKTLWEKQLQFRKIRDTLLANPLGVSLRNHVPIASLERAVCDMIYLNPGASFDNIRPISLPKIREIMTMYPPSTQIHITTTLWLI